MSAWLRILAIFAAAIVSALFLKVLPPVIVLVAFIAGFAAVNIMLKRRMRHEQAEVRSHVTALRREARDPFGLLGFPFALFGRGERAAIEDLRWGTWQGMEVKRFDVAFGSGSEAAGRIRLACAIGPSGPAPLPLVIESEVLSGLLADPPVERVVLGEGEVQDEVRSRYVVRSQDPAFARALVTPSTLRWLAGLEDPWGFEVSGSLALAYGPPSVGMDEPIERMKEFVERALPGLGPTAPRSDAGHHTGTSLAVSQDPDDASQRDA